MKYRMLNGKIAEADSLRQLAEIMNEMVMTPVSYTHLRAHET